MSFSAGEQAPRRVVPRWLVATCVLAAAAAVGTAQVGSPFFREAEKDGRIHVFSSSACFDAWQRSGAMCTSITLAGRGANGETLVGEDETAIDLYLVRHGLPAYERPAPPPVAAPTLPRTAIGGRVFADVTWKENEDEGTGVDSDDSGVGVDLKRFYLTVTHTFNATWSAEFQTDVGDAGSKRYDVFVKKANIQARISDAAAFRIGAADTPWIPFVEAIYGQRYFEQTITDSLGFGYSAEWGLHGLGKTAGNTLAYAFTIGNGKGYSSPTRSGSVDFEGRVSYEPVAGLTFALGGYSGKRGNDTDATPALHTATRVNALANWVIGRVRIGGEYFTADNWNQVAKVPEDSSDGFSGWLQVTVGPGWMLFGRYDSANPSKDLNPALELTSYDLGVQWKPLKPLTVALATKHAEVEGGTISTGNGTIGSTTPGARGTYDEVGFWLCFDF